MSIWNFQIYLKQAFTLYTLVKKFIWMQIYCIGLTIISFMFSEDGEEIKDNFENRGRFFSDDKFKSSNINLKTTDEKISFPLDTSSFVITDVVESTRLYNSNPQLMKESLDLHYKIIYSLVEKYLGHIVCNEGDSFQLLFKKLENSIEFCKEFFILHAKSVSYFQVRAGVGISQGRLHTRKFCGYKVFGSPINEILGIVNHNCGNCICVKHSILKKCGIPSTEIFCVH